MSDGLPFVWQILSYVLGLLGFDINMQTVCWNISFIFGSVFLVWGIVYLALKNNRREDHFIKAGFFEFLASWIMYIPDELFNEIPDSDPAIKTLDGVLTAMLRAVSIYQGNDYRRVVFCGQSMFAGAYAFEMTLANILLLAFAAGFIIKFLDGPAQQIKLSIFGWGKKTYIFPVCNEKTLTTANTIKDSKKNTIFACNIKELSASDKERITKNGGLYIDGTVTEALQRVAKRSKDIEIFLFGDNEEDNLAQLENVCAVVGQYKDVKIRIFVELLETPWSLYDDYIKKIDSETNERVVINFIRMEESFVYNDLLSNSIFENAIDKGKGIPRAIKFLLVGMNERNLEMFKAVLHLSQMPGYELTLMVLDPGAKREELKRRMPEIDDVRTREGDAIYRIIYKENVSLMTDEFENIINTEFSDFTFAFINTGDDLANTNLAMRLNTVCYRNRRDKEERPYRIQVNVVNDDICNKWNPKMTEHIDIIGGISKTYSYSFITMSDIEKGTVAIHEVRNKDTSWVSYCNNEYNRHSVYARTLSFKYKVWLIDRDYKSDYSVTKDGEMWRVYEHMRWNVYTRTLGYVADKSNLLDRNNVDKNLRSAAKIHYDLVDFDKLPAKEKEKDSLDITKDGIADILKSIPENKAGVKGT